MAHKASPAQGSAAGKLPGKSGGDVQKDEANMACMILCYKYNGCNAHIHVF
jgi:hypothetical protein